jgi:hypothetical protein
MQTLLGIQPSHRDTDYIISISSEGLVKVGMLDCVVDDRHSTVVLNEWHMHTDIRLHPHIISQEQMW